MKKINLSLLSLLAMQNLLYANFNLDGEVRFRFEQFKNMNEKYYGNKPKVGESDDNYLLSRVRIGTNYNFNDNLMARVSLQDSRVLGWGFEDKDWYNKEFNRENNPQKDNLELYETYLKFNNKNFSIQLGRQKIAYGDFRVFGPGEWKNSGKWLWDAMRVSLKSKNNFLDIFYGGTMLHEPSELSLKHRHGYYGGGIYGHYEFKENSAIEPIFAYKENKNSNASYLSLESYYLGFRTYDKNLNNLFYDLTYIKSFGDFKKLNSKSVDIDGYGLHLDGGYNFKDLNTKVGVGYTYASGDSPQSSDRESFDAVFGASDKYYGRMNLMSWSNLNDYELFAIFKPYPKTNIKLEYHKFYADEPTNKWKSYTISSMQNDEYGDEIDIVTKYKYNKQIDLTLGVSYFKAGDFIKEASEKNEFISDDNAYSVFAGFQYKFNI